jgi:hypothetical protein
MEKKTSYERIVFDAYFYWSDYCFGGAVEVFTSIFRYNGGYNPHNLGYLGI